VEPVTTKEALMTENGRNNPNIQDGGNAILYMACLLSQKGGSPTSRIGVRLANYLPILTFFTSFQEVYKEAKTGWIPDDEPVHTNKDKNRVVECPNTFPEGEACPAEQRDG
jgi:hypothetical protein